MDMIAFNKPYMTGRELLNIAEAHFQGRFAGDGPKTHACHEWLKKNIGVPKALLTHSCTAALEMCALLLDIQPGDEVLMPSYTFVSTANAFALRGGVPVFIDIRSDTLNIDEALIEDAITEKTKAIVVVHYAGVGCEMDPILDIAKRHNIPVIEDAAQGLQSKYKGKYLGTFGPLGTLSFHETKNIISGEGGALLVNCVEMAERAEIIREKGTDRSRFFRGEVDKYTWQTLGSSFLPGELIACFLLAQMHEAQAINAARYVRWARYHVLLEDLEREGKITRPFIPDHCEHNAHLYYIILEKRFNREVFLRKLFDKGIQGVSHYVPLHSSPAGKKYGKVFGQLPNTDYYSEQIVRLPLWVELSEDNQEYISNVIHHFLA